MRRRIATIDPFTDRTTSVYDAVGHQTQRFDPRGIVATYLYDVSDNLVGRHYPVDPPVTFAYDALNQRTLVQDVLGRTTFSYDPLGRTISMVDFAHRRLSYSYDAASQRTVLVAPGTDRFTSSYDAAGRLTRLINPQGRVTTVQYDAAGRRTATLLTSGVRTSTIYDAADQVDQIIHRQDASTVIGELTYDYDVAGQRKGLAELDWPAPQILIHVHENLKVPLRARRNSMSTPPHALLLHEKTRRSTAKASWQFAEWTWGEVQ